MFKLSTQIITVFRKTLHSLQGEITKRNCSSILCATRQDFQQALILQHQALKMDDLYNQYQFSSDSFQCGNCYCGTLIPVQPAGSRYLSSYSETETQLQDNQAKCKSTHSAHRKKQKKTIKKNQCFHSCRDGKKLKKKLAKQSNNRTSTASNQKTMKPTCLGQNLKSKQKPVTSVHLGSNIANDHPSTSNSSSRQEVNPNIQKQTNLDKKSDTRREAPDNASPRNIDTDAVAKDAQSSSTSAESETPLPVTKASKGPDKQDFKQMTSSSPDVKVDNLQEDLKSSSSVITKHSDQLHRRWLYPSHRQCHKTSFSVLSYNILSQTLLDNNLHLYWRCDDAVLPWEFRWNNLKKELESFHADIVCLQEVEEVHYMECIKSWLHSAGYNHAYKKRTGNDRLKPDGVLIACSNSKFKVIEAIPVEYYRNNDPSTNWHNVGLILVLQLPTSDQANPYYLCVANTHLLYNPKRGDIKLIQLATLFAEIDRVMKRFAEKSGYLLPLILCGDFNSTPFSRLVDLVTSAKLDYEGLTPRQISGQRAPACGYLLSAGLIPHCLNIDDSCTFATPENLRKGNPSYSLQHNLGPLVSSGNIHKKADATTLQDRGITVDYIFYSSDKNCAGTSNSSNIDSSTTNSMQPKTTSLTLKRHLSPCKNSDVHAVGLPNSVHPSDHLPVLAEFGIEMN